MPLPGKTETSLSEQGDMSRRTIALLGAFCFLLSTVEYLIPKPLPFLRLGLANLPLILGIDLFPFKSFLLLALLKIAGQGLITGTLFSYVFLFSLAGTGSAAALMYFLRRFFGSRRISFIGVSAAGALVSNGAQLLLAYFFLLGKSARYLAAPVLGFGIVTGTLLGIFCEYFAGQSRWYASVTTSTPAAPVSPAAEPEGGIAGPQSPGRDSPRTWAEAFRNRRREIYQRVFSGSSLAIAGLLMLPAFLLNSGIPAKSLQFAFFWFLAWVSGRKNNPPANILVIVFITAFNLLIPYGEVLFSLGNLKITSGALLGGLRRGITLEGLFMLSRFCVRQDLGLPGSFGNLAGESFKLFSLISERKHLLNRKNFAASIDALLIELSRAPQDHAATAGGKTGSAEMQDCAGKSGRRLGIALLTVAVIFAWLPLLWSQYERLLYR
jgi:heptaprenyl diphosphate synthase